MERFFASILLAMMVACAAHAAEDDRKLPLPRFASLKAAQTNVRAGPGTRYSIIWVYKRAALPVEIIQEFDVWREIRDQEGTVGWVHKNMLSGHRTAVILKTTRALRRTPDSDSATLLRAEPGVLAQLLACDRNWCRLQIDSRKGWLRKGEFWGAYPKEEFKD